MVFVVGNGAVDATLLVEALSPAGTVKGTVRSAGVGVGGVSVSAGEVSTTTAADGSYVLDGVDVGTTQLTFSKATYVPVQLSVGVSQGATATLDASLSHVQTGCTITRSPSASALTYKRKKGVAKFTLKATLAGPYGAFSANTVYLQYSANGKSGWTTLAKLSTDASGVASKAITAKKKSTKYYRWYAPGNSTHTAAYSAKQKVAVK